MVEIDCGLVVVEKSESSLRDLWQSTNSLEPGWILYLTPATAANRLQFFGILNATRIRSNVFGTSMNGNITEKEMNGLFDST